MGHLMKRFFSIVGKLILLVLVLCLIAYGVMLVVNCKDQPPSQDYLDLVASFDVSKQIPDSGNAYLYIYGFSADRGVEPIVEGRRRVDWVVDEIKNDPADFPELERGEWLEELPEERELYEHCRDLAQDCLDYLEESARQVREVIETRSLLLSRYESLVSHTQYQNVGPYLLQAPFADYSTVMNSQLIKLIHLYLSQKAGDVVDVSEMLAADYRYWRMMSRNSGILIDRMIALAALRRHFQWGNLISRVAAESGKPIHVSEWSEPFSSGELSLSQVFDGEAFFNTNILLYMDSSDVSDIYEPEHSWLVEKWFETRNYLFFAPFLKKQDANNRQVSCMQALADAYDVSSQSLTTVLNSSYMDVEECDFDLGLYNPIGKILVGIGAPNYEGYVVRAYEVEVQRQLLNLAIKFRSESIAPSEIPAALEQSDFRNPYTSLPFEWDGEKQELVFNGLQKGHRARFSLPY